MIGALFTVLFAGCGSDLQRGWNAYEKQEYSSAFEVWQPMAENGDARAQFYVGLMYDEGKGITRDHHKAAQ